MSANPRNVISECTDKKILATVVIAGAERYCSFYVFTHESKVRFLQASVAFIKLAPHSAQELTLAMGRYEDTLNIGLACTEDGSVNWISDWPIVGDDNSDTALLGNWLAFVDSEFYTLDEIVAEAFPPQVVKTPRRKPFLRLVSTSKDP